MHGNTRWALILPSLFKTALAAYHITFPSSSSYLLSITRMDNRRLATVCKPTVETTRAAAPLEKIISSPVVGFQYWFIMHGIDMHAA